MRRWHQSAWRGSAGIEITCIWISLICDVSQLKISDFFGMPNSELWHSCHKWTIWSFTAAPCTAALSQRITASPRASYDSCSVHTVIKGTLFAKYEVFGKALFFTECRAWWLCNFCIFLSYEKINEQNTDIRVTFYVKDHKHTHWFCTGALFWAKYYTPVVRNFRVEPGNNYIWFHMEKMYTDQEQIYREANENAPHLDGPLPRTWEWPQINIHIRT